MQRKTRFVCVSDTHGYTPSEAGFRLPAGDVLIHAGDLTNQGRKSELRKTIDWIANAEFEIKIVVAGNHDITLDPDFYATHGSSFHNQHLENPEECIDIVAQSSPSILYLRHQSAVVRLTRKDGPRTAFKVFGSPYSQFKGNWAFGFQDADAISLWTKIPRDADIVVTHTPPWSLCDSGPGRPSAGCKTLSQALSIVRPILAVCGHVHEGRGYVRARWPSQGEADAECASKCEVFSGDLPPTGSKRQSLVDLTGKRGRQLENEGLSQTPASPSEILTPRATGDGLPHVQFDDTSGHTAIDNQLPMQCSGENPSFRAVRREICVVNAAIMATSWPHIGGRKFNAPIVVNILLPVWQD